MRLRLGTRRSKLALAQAEEVAAALRALGAEVDLVPVVTAGDRGAGPEPALAPAGLKGLFVGEIVAALQEGRIDLAVHSAKDLPAADPPGVVVAAVPERADPRDVLVSRDAAVPRAATIGTSSLRRRAQLARLRPGARSVELRGNVDTRLRKLADGGLDAIVLAAAGLARLGLRPDHVAAFGIAEMLPAPGQGALAVEVRLADPGTFEMVKVLDHPASRSAYEAERALVARLGGGCSLPLGAFAEVGANGVRLRAMVISPDGSEVAEADAEAETPSAVADAVAEILLAGGAGAILAEVAGR